MKDNVIVKLENVSKRFDKADVIKNISHAEVLYVESYVRLMMSKVPGMRNVKNDHFEYTIIKGEKYNQANTLADLAMCFAKKACQDIGVKYEEGKRKYKK